MNTTDSDYALEPTAFRSMGGAQQLTDALEEIIHDHRMGAANVRPELVEIFSEIVNNAAGHGMSDKGAHAHVRFMPHRRVMAFDAVIVDSDPGIRGTLARNPALPEIETDADAIGLAVQELISGTGIPTRGIGLWMTLTEMRKTGRKMFIHSGSGLLTVYGTAETELRWTAHRQRTVARVTIPARPERHYRHAAQGP